MAERARPAVICAAERSGVAVPSRARRRPPSAILAAKLPPRRFALRRWFVERNEPISRDGRDGCRWRYCWRGADRPEVIRGSACASVVPPVEPIVVVRNDQLRAILVKGQHKLALVVRAGPRGALQIAVEETARKGRRRAGDFEWKRNLDIIHDDRRVPQAGGTLLPVACASGR